MAETTPQLKGAYLNRYRGLDKPRSGLDAGAKRRRPEGVRAAREAPIESIPTEGCEQTDRTGTIQ